MNIKKNRTWLLLMVLLAMAVPIKAMEMGGFDISVGSGEIPEFPVQESLPRESSGLEEAAVPSGSGEVGEIGQTTWEQEDSFGDEIWIPSENTGQSFDGQSLGNTQDQTAVHQTVPTIPPTPAVMPEKIQEAAPETKPQENKTETKPQETIPETKPQENKQETKSQENKPEKAAEKTPTKMPIKTPTEKPTDIPAPSKEISVTPNQTQKKPSAFPTPSPTLAFFRRDTDTSAKGRQLLVYYKEAQTEPCDKPQFLLKANGAVHILSVRINRKECPWHWQGELLILENPAKQQENSIELIALYETGSQVNAVFQKG